MDFLTRLAQRLTGELPAVQPRLPLRFEPAAGIAQPAPFPADENRLPAPEPPWALQAAVPSTRPAPIQRAQVPEAVVQSDAPVRRSLSGAESARPAASPAADVSRNRIPSSFDTIPDPERRPPPPNAQSPRRVRVEIRPAAANSASLPPPADSRRGVAALGQMNDQAQQLPANGTTASGPTPPTVHIHIGRVDVRAVMPPAAPPRPASRPAAPRATLEDYLSGRKGGSQP
jgi:hypothetical protein